MVSVILAVKNGAQFITEALASVAAQAYEPLEIIVIDGHSSDVTPRLAQECPQARYFLQDGSGGVADAYNQGIAAAQGELIAFISHDDLWAKGKLHAQVAYLQEHPQVQYIVGQVMFFLEPGQALPAGFRPELLIGSHVGRIMETLLARREVFAVVGPFRTDLSTAEDVDWYARAHDAGVVSAVLPQIVLHKRVHNANISLQSTENNRNLLQAVRASLQRKRQPS